MEELDESQPRSPWKLASGPLLALIAAGWASQTGLSSSITITLAVTVWVAAWWVSAAIPHAFTSLLPLALLPLTGVLSAKQVAEAYGNPLILLLAGGFMMAAALQKNGAHRRLALGMVHLFGGGSGRRLVWGFAFATGLTSMWISNTATTLMMMPVALAILECYPDRRLAVPLLLAIAYAASIGGLGTPVGSPPNLVFMQVYAQTTGTSLGFSDWLVFGLPTVALLLPALSWWMARSLRGTPAAALPAQGAWNAGERRVLIVFALVALAWITRSEPFGGWSAWLNLPKANDASVALLGAVMMALVPNGRGGPLLDWKTAQTIPWGALILFGGGIALATAFEASGLSTLIANSLQGLLSWPLLIQIALIVACVTLLSEIASNTATAVLLMPLLAAAATAAQVDPALLMVPAVLAASCGFMLPVATAPNAIVFASPLIEARDMLRHGAVLDVFCVIAISAVCYVLLR